MTDFRCKNCNRLLFRGTIDSVQIKCPRCGVVLNLKPQSLPEGQNIIQGDSHGKSQCVQYE